MRESVPTQTEIASRDLLARLRGSYFSASMTILSIIQGVALAALAAALAANYTRLSPAQFVLAADTFGVLIAVYTQILFDTMSWLQVPSFQGALVPFLTGAVELFLVATISTNMTFWLIGASVMIGLSSFGLANVWQLASADPENAPLLARVRGMRRSAHWYNVAGVVLFAVLAGASFTGLLRDVDSATSMDGIAETVAAVVPGLWVASWLQRSAWYWRKIVAFARTGE
jgi:hypothetical protein